MKREVFDLSETIKNKNPLIKIFYNWKFRKAIEFADITQDEVCLDFGCGGKYLKGFIKNYIGYDINKEFTEIKDYTKIKPDVIFLLDVLEHIEKSELEILIKKFKEMNPKVRIIVIIPNETWMWGFIRRILLLPIMDKDHVTNIKEILEIINKEFILIRRFSFLSLSYLYEFK